MAKFKLALGIVASLLFALAPAAVVYAKDANSKSSVSKKHPKKVKVVLRKGTHNTAAAPHERTVRRVITVHGKRKVVYQKVSSAAVAMAAPIPTMGDLAGLNLTRDPLDLKSSVALVLDQSNSEVLFEKNSNVALPIASITKMMTGLIVVQAHQDMDEMLTVTDDDVDRVKFSSSRLKVGAQLSRANMLHI